MMVVVSRNSALFGGMPSGQSVSDLPLKFKDIIFILAGFDTLKSILPLNIVVLRLDVSFGSKPCK